MDGSTACEDNEISKISNEMKEFSRKMKVFQKLNSSDVFVNPLYGGLVDMSRVKINIKSYSKLSN